MPSARSASPDGHIKHASEIHLHTCKSTQSMNHQICNIMRRGNTITLLAVRNYCFFLDTFYLLISYISPAHSTLQQPLALEHFSLPRKIVTMRLHTHGTCKIPPRSVAIRSEQPCSPPTRPTDRPLLFQSHDQVFSLFFHSVLFRE